MTDTEAAFDEPVLAWQPLSSRFLPRLLTGKVFTVAAVAIGVSLGTALIGRTEGIPAWAWALLPAYLAGHMAVLPAAIRRSGYVLRQDELQFRKGLLVRRRKAVPLRRVQHVETLRGPLDRIFGLSTLRLYTAAAGSGNLTIEGLDVADANELRHRIVERVRGEIDSDD